MLQDAKVWPEAGWELWTENQTDHVSLTVSLRQVFCNIDRYSIMRSAKSKNGIRMSIGKPTRTHPFGKYEEFVDALTQTMGN